MPFRVVLVLAISFACGAFEIFYEENFDTDNWETYWVNSKWSGVHGPGEEFEWSAGENPVDEEVQKGIRTAHNMHYHSASAMFEKPFTNRNKTLLIQYSLWHEKYHKRFCGGGYIKLISSDVDPFFFGGDSDYNIMFGPDMCHADYSKIHLIIKFKDQHLEKVRKIDWDTKHMNSVPHLWTLMIFPNNTYQASVDWDVISEGDLHNNWDFPKEDDPDYVEDVYIFEDIGGIGLELWSPESGSIFDNFLVCEDCVEYAKNIYNKKLKEIFWEEEIREKERELEAEKEKEALNRERSKKARKRMKKAEERKREKEELRKKKSKKRRRRKRRMYIVKDEDDEDFKAHYAVDDDGAPISPVYRAAKDLEEHNEQFDDDEL